MLAEVVMYIFVYILFFIVIIVTTYLSDERANGLVPPSQDNRYSRRHIIYLVQGYNVLLFYESW